MSEHSTQSSTNEAWCQYAKYYDPILIGSIDGTDTEPHDKAIVRAENSEYRHNRHVKGRPECTLFVARLSAKTTKETIKNTFSKYGRLRRFRMVKDIVTGAPKGYAFIEYESERAAEEAYRKANKLHIDGQAIFVDFECERLLKGWKPRRLGGGFGGRKESGQLRFGGRDRPFRKPIDLEIHEEQHHRNRHQEYQSNHEKYRYKNERRRSRGSRDRSEREQSCRSRDSRENMEKSGTERSREFSKNKNSSENNVVNGNDLA